MPFTSRARATARSERRSASCTSPAANAISARAAANQSAKTIEGGERRMRLTDACGVMQRFGTRQALLHNTLRLGDLALCGQAHAEKHVRQNPLLPVGDPGQWWKR